MSNMSAKYIKENNISSRYLHGHLTPEESIQFEQYLMDKPELIEQLEIDMAFKSRLVDYDFGAEKPKTLRNWFFNTPLGASFSTLTACCMVFYLYSVNGNGPADFHPGALLAKQSQVVFLDTLRGSGDMPQSPTSILISKGTKSISLGIPLDPNYPDIEYKTRISHPKIVNGQYSTPCRLADQSGHFFITLDENPLQEGLYIIDSIPCHDKLTSRRLSIYLTYQE